MSVHLTTNTEVKLLFRVNQQFAFASPYPLFQTKEGNMLPVMACDGNEASCPLSL